MRQEPRHSRSLCGATTRDGTACVARVVENMDRCKHHGGLSTGPLTPAGREKIAEGQRKRHAKNAMLEKLVKEILADPEHQALLKRVEEARRQGKYNYDFSAFTGMFPDLKDAFRKIIPDVIVEFPPQPKRRRRASKEDI